MSWFRQYARSSIGMKQLMAVTGLLLAGFVLAHMLGNLQIFAGRHQLNDYAAKLQGLGPLLWLMRGGLLVIFLLHVAAGARLARLNIEARPEKYKVFKPQKTTWYARLMPMSGVFLLLFVAAHIGHFTLGVIQPEAHNLWENAAGHTVEVLEQGVRHDVYGMMIVGFLNPIVAYGYMVAMGFLCMHLAHGVSSFLQTLGFNHPKYNGLIHSIGPIYGWVLFIGNISMPLAIQLKVLVI